MICPHCNKPIKLGVTEETKRRIIDLWRLDFSSRDIEKTLARDSIHVSWTSVSRIIKAHKEGKPE